MLSLSAKGSAFGDGAVDEKASHTGRQGAGPFVQRIPADVGNGMRADQIGEVGHSHQPGIGSGGVDKNRGDDRRRRDSLPFQSNSVVQTARRAPPSIPDAGYYEIGVAMQVRQYLGVGWQ